MRRITIIRVVLSILVTPFLVVLYLNIEKWAESRGHDLYLTNLIVPPEGVVVNPLVSYALRPEMFYVALAAVAFMTGIWCDALLRRSESKRIPKEERIKNLGFKCLGLVGKIEAASAGLRINGNESTFTSLWSEFIPVSVELEKIGFVTPDHGIQSKEDMSAVRVYMEFVGNLLSNGHVRMAKKAARSLLEEPTRLSAAKLKTFSWPASARSKMKSPS